MGKHPIVYVKNQKMKEAFENNSNWGNIEVVSMDIPNQPIHKRLQFRIKRFFRRWKNE